jgi:hypothetical protein
MKTAQIADDPGFELRYLERSSGEVRTHAFSPANGETEMTVLPQANIADFPVVGSFSMPAIKIGVNGQRVVVMTCDNVVLGEVDYFLQLLELAAQKRT